MDIEREKQLIDAIDTLEKEFEKTKRKRCLITILCLSVAFYILFLWLGEMQDIKDYLIGLISAPIGACLYFYINMIIFAPVINGGTREAVILERLHAELNLLRRE